MMMMMKVSNILSFGVILWAGHVASASDAEPLLAQNNLRGRDNNEHVSIGITGIEQDDGQGHRDLVQTIPWSISRIQADQVQPLPDPSLIKVCIVGTGYDHSHPDLPMLNVPDDGFSYYGEDWFQDGHVGEGTHNAGIIAALNNNDGVVGVFPNVSLFVSKGLKQDGTGTKARAIWAIEKCIDNGAKVISIGFVGRKKHFTKSDKSFFDRAYKNHNILFVASAGNSGNNAKAYPASYPSVMSVTAVDYNNTIASFSQHNNQVELSAPGVDVLSTLPGNSSYGLMSGSHVATPHVAGVAALVWSHDPSCTAQQIRRILLASSLGLGASDCNVNYGRGLVQAKAAVDMLQQGGCTAADGLPLLDANGLTSRGTCASY